MLHNVSQIRITQNPHGFTDQKTWFSSHSANVSRNHGYPFSQLKMKVSSAVMAVSLRLTRRKMNLIDTIPIFTDRGTGEGLDIFVAVGK